MQNSMVMFTFSVLDQEYAFWANLVQKIKIVSSRWNSTLKLIQICKIHIHIGDVHFFRFRSEIPCLEQFRPKNQNVSLRWNLIPRLIRICWIQWCCSLFSFLTGNALLGQIWSKLSIFTVFFVSDQKCSFLGKFGPKCQSCQFKAKFASYNLLQNIFGI